MQLTFDGKARHVALVTHAGKVVAFNVRDDGGLSYVVKRDDETWDQLCELPLPDDPEDRSVLERQRDGDPVVAVYASRRRGVVAPVQVVSDGKHIHLFRRSDTGTLLVDRFLLDVVGHRLSRKIEVRYKRSGQRFAPLQGRGEHDSLDYRSTSGALFFEPTSELRCVQAAGDFRFAVVLAPTDVHEQQRWHIFVAGLAGDTVDVYSLRKPEHGIFEVADHRRTLAGGPRLDPGLVRRTIGLDGLKITGGLSATLYADQARALGEGGEELILRRGLKVLLAAAAGDHSPPALADEATGAALLSFDLAADGSLAPPAPGVQVNEQALRQDVEEVLLPLDHLRSIRLGEAAQAGLFGFRRTGREFAGDRGIDLGELPAGLRALTIEAWVRPGRLDVDQRILGDDASGLALDLLADGSTLRFTPGPGVEITTVIDKLLVGEWVHIAVAHDPRARLARITVDGAAATLVVPGKDLSRPLPAGPLQLHAGARADASAPFTGGLAELRVWDTALTGDDVSHRMYHRLTGVEPHLVAYAPLDAHGLRLAGDGERLVASGLQWPADGPVTLDCWLHLAAADVRDAVLLRIGGEAGDPFTVAFAADRSLRWHYGRSEASRLHADYAAKLDRWTHVALVSTGKPGGRTAIYLDGELAAELASAEAPASFRVGLALGGEFRGSLKELRIWRRARDVAEIRRSMHRQASSGAPGLALHYPMEGIVAGEVVDRSPTGAHAAVIGSGVAVETARAFEFPRKLPGGEPALAYKTDVLVPVVQGATYVESVELRTDGDLDGAVDFMFWGRTARSGEVLGEQTVRAQLTDLGGGWRRASARYTIPAGMTHLRVTHLLPPDGAWTSMLLRHPRLERISRTITLASTHETHALPAMRAGQADAERIVDGVIELEARIARVGARINELQAALSNNDGELHARITALHAERAPLLYEITTIEGRANDIRVGDPLALRCVDQAGNWTGHVWAATVQWWGHPQADPRVRFETPYWITIQGAQSLAQFLTGPHSSGPYPLHVDASGRVQGLNPMDMHFVGSFVAGFNNFVITRAAEPPWRIADLQRLAECQQQQTVKAHEIFQLQALIAQRQTDRAAVQAELTEKQALLPQLRAQLTDRALAAVVALREPIVAAGLAPLVAGPLVVSGARVLGWRTAAPHALESVDGTVQVYFGTAGDRLQPPAVYDSFDATWQIPRRTRPGLKLAGGLATAAGALELGATAALTVELSLVVYGGTGGWVNLVSKGSAGEAGFALALHLGNRSLRWQCGNGGATVTSNSWAVQPGVWQQIAATLDVAGKQARIFVDGVQVAVGAVDRAVQLGKEPLVIGGPAAGDSGQPDAVFSDVRVWSVHKQPAELRADRYRRLTGSEVGLAGLWALDDGQGDLARDRAPGHRHASISGAAQWWIATHGRVAADQATTPIVVGEYGAVEHSGGKQAATMRRCVADTRGGDLFASVGARVAELELAWVGNAQFEPTLIGYIEGPPPVPSENLTVDDSYAAVSTVELVQSSSTVMGVRRSQDLGVDSALSFYAGIETSGTVGVGFLGVATVDYSVRGTVQGALELGFASIAEVSDSAEIRLNFSDQLTVVGHREKVAAHPQLGRRFIPKNVGYAVVMATLADVFLLRTRHTRRMVGFQMVPVEGVDPEVSVISFLINPAYTMNGTLDGQVGTRPADPRFYRDVPAMRAQYGSRYPSSYFRQGEAQALRRRIEAEDRQREADYVNLNASLVTALSIPELRRRDKPKTKEESEALARGGAERVEELLDHKPESLAQFAEQMRQIAGKRNIVNAYVWDADGGLRSETQEFINTVSVSAGSNFSFRGMLGVGASLTMGLTVGFDAMFGGHMTLQMQKDRVDSIGFGLNVALGVERRDITDAFDYALYPGEKVSRYRFMSFYLEPGSEHFEHFFDTLVDPDWLQGNSEEAIALRSIDRSKPNMAWRVLHRVTFVERAATAGPGGGAGLVDGDSQSQAPGTGSGPTGGGTGVGGLSGDGGLPAPSDADLGDKPKPKPKPADKQPDPAAPDPNKPIPAPPKRPVPKPIPDPPNKPAPAPPAKPAPAPPNKPAPAPPAKPAPAPPAKPKPVPPKK